MPRIPALTLSGGKIHSQSKEIKEYRCWVHPYGGGDDFYYTAKTYPEALNLYYRLLRINEGRVEKPLGVIKTKDGYREVVLTHTSKKIRPPKPSHQAFKKIIYAKRGYHGIVNRPTRFLVGEKGPERVNVTPIKKHKPLHNKGLHIGKINIGNVKIKKFI